MFDKDGGGSISPDEIKQILSFGQNLDEKVINDIIKQVDANGDGEISYGSSHKWCSRISNEEPYERKNLEIDNFLLSKLSYIPETPTF